MFFDFIIISGIFISQKIKSPKAGQQRTDRNNMITMR